MSIDSTLTRRMSSSRPLSLKKHFVQTTLPWLIAGGGLLVYLVSLNHWVTFRSVGQVASLSGWSPDPRLQGPLYWLLTMPIGWLPRPAIPLALNLFSAICAALTLALLARSVALLPHNRTEPQRERERHPLGLLSISAAWVPPVVAAVVCGLQLTFWENATAASEEMLNLLLFAYVIRCLLEFRIDGRDGWLWQASLVYGAGMATNWAMIGFFPVFLIALIWLRGVGFFSTRFLLRMFVFGVAGLSLYLVLPIVNAASGKFDLTFWQGLRANVAYEKFFVTQVVFNKLMLLNGFAPSFRPLWVLGLPSLLPLLAMGVRWPAYFGDPSKLGVTLTTFIFHFLHGVLLVFCLWVALDPHSFGPRQLLEGKIPGLTLYYLTALSIGYYIGYFLLVFGTKPAGRPRSTAAWVPLVYRAVLAVALALCVLAPVLLLARNVPQIRITNGRLLRQTVNLMTEQLPSQGSILLSDNLDWLALNQSALTQAGKAKAYEFVFTGGLESPPYYKFLKRTYPLFRDVPAWRIPRSEQEQTAERVKLVQVLLKLAQTNQIYYLHPSFGYYFEGFYPEPHGMVYKMVAYSSNVLTAPLPGNQTVAENESFWERANSVVAGTTAEKAPANGLMAGLESALRLGRAEANVDASQVRQKFSRALNFWGVRLQRSGRLAAAASRFEQAIRLNGDNIAAQINLACNHNLQAGKPVPVELSKSQEEQFGKYAGGWNDVLTECGPFDEQRSCLREGQAFFQNSNFRQAAGEFLRVKQFEPDNLRARMLLAQSYLLAWLPDAALEETAQIHTQADQLGLTRTNAAGVLATEMAAHLTKDELNGAEKALQIALAQYPDDPSLLFNAGRIYMNYGRYSNALPCIETLLKLTPDSPGLLYAKGQSCLVLSNYSAAIESFSSVLQLETNRAVRLQALSGRAQANLASGKLDDAQRDAEALQRELPDSQVQSRMNTTAFLGDVAYRKRDTNTALRIYQLYLTKLPTNEVEAIKLVSARINELKPRSN